MTNQFEEKSRSYFAHSAKLAQWIVALTTGEMAFILSLSLFRLEILFYVFLTFSLLSIFIAILIMYVIAIVEDIRLQGVLIVEIIPSLSRPDFEKFTTNRIGKIQAWLVEKIIYYKAFQLLVLSFTFASIFMLILTFRYSGPS